MVALDFVVNKIIFDYYEHNNNNNNSIKEWIILEEKPQLVRLAVNG